MSFLGEDTEEGGKKGKKKAKTKEWRFEDYIGYGAVAVGIAALASIVILKSGTRQ